MPHILYQQKNNFEKTNPRIDSKLSYSGCSEDQQNGSAIVFTFVHTDIQSLHSRFDPDKIDRE